MSQKSKTPARLAIVATVVFSCLALVARPVFSDESVAVFATVEPAPKSPMVMAVTPLLSPITVAKGASQTVSLTVRDTDNTGSGIVYTVSVSSGAVIPQNGTVSVVNGTAYVDFTYYAPPSKAKLVPVTVTLNDLSSAPVTVKTVDMYVY